MKITLLASISLLGFAAWASAGPSASVRVEGLGHFRFEREGRAVYAKSATLVSERGEIRASSGESLMPPIRVTAKVEGIELREDGTVVVQTASGTATLGRVMLAGFPESTALEPAGAFLVSRERASLGFATQGGFGKVVMAVKPAVSAPTPRIAPLVPKPEKGEAKTAGAVTVKIPAAVTLEGARITLGEIAQISGGDEEKLKSLDLGNAPLHGIPMQYSRERIQARLLASGIDRRALSLQMAATVEIRRRAQMIEGATLVERAKKAVFEKIGFEGELNADGRTADLEAPLGEAEIVVENVAIAAGSASVSLSIRIDGKRFIGRMVKLSGPMLETAVQSGETVQVRFVAAGITVEMSGRARSSGFVGQTIQVLVTLPETRETTTHEAVIKAPGIVEVRD